MPGVIVMSAIAPYVEPRNTPRKLRINTRLPPGTNFCKCALCGLRFKSVRAFDKHRIGVWPDRGCMPEAECPGLGLEKDPKGHWRFPKTKFRNVHLRVVR